MRKQIFYDLILLNLIIIPNNFYLKFIYVKEHLLKVFKLRFTLKPKYLEDKNRYSVEMKIIFHNLRRAFKYKNNKI